MTVKEFFDTEINRSGYIKAMNSYTDKVLFTTLSSKNFEKYKNHEIDAFWVEISSTKRLGYGNWANPVLCCYVSGWRIKEDE